MGIKTSKPDERDPVVLMDRARIERVYFVDGVEVSRALYLRLMGPGRRIELFRPRRGPGKST